MTTWRWTSLVGAGLRALIHQRIDHLSDLSFWKMETARVQRSQLRTLLKRASRTEVGRTHGFERLAGLDDDAMLEGYREARPIGDWHAYRDPVRRMREQGEPDVLWPGRVEFFAQTSGTTAGDKFIPVSRDMMRSNLRASLDIFAHAVRRGVSLPDLMIGRSLFLGGSSDLVANEAGIRTGDLSGIATTQIQWPLSAIYSPGRDIALMSDWPAKIEAMADATLDEDIRMVSGMPSWTLVLMERVLERARRRDPSISCIREVWPELKIFVHGGVRYAPFEQRLRDVWSGGSEDFPHRLELYPASEGFIAIQDVEGDPGMRLNSDIGLFHEFIPLEEFDRPDARAFTCETVEPGQRYVVVLTSCAGLWRYVLGDVVEFDSIPARLDGRGGSGPCRLRIVGRHRHFINAFGENLIVEHIENAVTEAAHAVGATIGEFTAAPVYPDGDRRAGLELVVEHDGRLEPRFGEAFDAALKRQNVDYTTKRTDSLGMAPPTITAVPPGTLHRWMASQGKLGGQHKFPRCANHREIVDSVHGLAAPTGAGGGS